MIIYITFSNENVRDGKRFVFSGVVGAKRMVITTKG